MFDFRSFFVVVLVFSPLEFGFADPTYGKVGDSVVLDPGRTSGPITSVTWKHRTDLALEWIEGELTYYRTFKDRCELDNTTGSFTIRNLTLQDSGEYTPEINNIVLGKKELKVFKPVPKPTVSVDCNNEKTVCDLTCEANITSEFGSVIYKWKTGDTELSNNKKLSVTPKNEESSFFCMLINPVNNSTSDEFPNPFSNTFSGGNSATTVIVLVALLLVFVVAVIGAAFMNRAGHLPFLDKIFPCNEKARSVKRRPALMKDGAAEAAYDTRQDDAVNVLVPLFSKENETNQDQVAETPNGRLHEGNRKPDDSTSNPSVDTQPEQEINSKGKEALNGYLLANTNDDGINKVSEMSDSVEQQQDPPTEQVSDDEGESGQNSNSEEPEPTAEGPGKPKDSTCDPSVDTHPEPESDPSAVTPEPNSQTEALSGDLLANTNEDGINKVSEMSDSVEQQQDPPTEQVSDDEGESGQNSNSEEPEPTAEGPETSPPESNSEETPDTGPAES